MINVTYKELCIQKIGLESEDMCQRIDMILAHIESASRHVDRGILCDKLELEARVFNHLVARDG